MRAEVREGAIGRERDGGAEPSGALAWVDGGVVGERADAGGVLPGTGFKTQNVRLVEASATLVASYRRYGVDPFAHPKEALTRIAATPVSRLDPFLPDRWKAAHLPDG